MPEATWHARWPGTLGSAGCDTSYTRWPDARSGRTRSQMPAESRSAAVPDRPSTLRLRPGKMIRLRSDEAVARRADDVGHLEGGPAHRFIAFANALPVGLETSIASSGLATA